jgi:nucleoside 2-deoxyribosyltransferase
MAKKIFVICTVRNATEDYLKNLYKYVEDLEAKGHEVYLPPRDTNQEDNETCGFRICKDNLAGIKWADEVHVSYNPASTGTHFDLGMAFSLHKKIVLFENLSNETTTGKSFQNMIKYWENVCDTCLDGYSFVGHNFDECPKCGEKF